MPASIPAPIPAPKPGADAQTVNIAAYKFVTIEDCSELRARILDSAALHELKGTVLLAPEGINLFMAGHYEGLVNWWTELCADPRFRNLQAKVSYSREVPFKRLRVKLKREIITMNQPLIRPEQARAPALAPATLKRWLDAGCDDHGRPLVLLDTRNGFEVTHGTFDGAIDWQLKSFSEFPAAVKRELDSSLDQLKDHTVVTFCTGGIRCEKAAIVLTEAGLPTVWQLDGGILNYLETVGEAHWHGACFVFDERAALTADLQPLW